MSSFLSIFIVVFVLVLAACCALLVLRMLDHTRRQSPRFPPHRTRHPYAPSHSARETTAQPNREQMVRKP